MKKKQIKPTRLNISKMWELYLLLQPAIKNKKQEELALDEIFRILVESKPEALLECLHILYDNKDVQFSTPAEITVMFIEGLSRNEFFEFCGFIQGITDGSTK